MKIHVYYDDFGDYIEIYTGNHKEHAFLNLTGDVFELQNRKTKKTEGFAIHAFRKLTQNLLKIKGIGIHYDEPGDLLELGVVRPSAGYLESVEKGIFQRIDEKTGKTIGIAIHGLRQRTKKKMETEISLPQKIELVH